MQSLHIPTVSDTEERNYSSVNKLVHIFGSHLPKLFEKAWFSKNGVNWRVSEGKELVRNLKLQKFQLQLVSEGIHTNWDISLYANIARSTSIFDDLTKNAIAQLSIIRNACAHSQGTLSNSQKESFCNTLRKLAIGDVFSELEPEYIDSFISSYDVDSSFLPEFNEKATQNAIKHKEEGNKLLKEEKLLDAISHYSAGISESGVDHKILSQLHCNRANALCSLKKYKEAGSDAKAAMEYQPDWTKPIYRLSVCYRNRRVFEKEAKTLEKCLGIAAIKRDSASESDIKLFKEKLDLCRLALNKKSREEEQNLAYSAISRSEGAFSKAKLAQGGFNKQPGIEMLDKIPNDFPMKAAWKHIWAAHKYLSNGQDAAAYREFLAAAELGNAEGMYNVAVLINNGCFGEPDLAKVVHWAQKATQVENNHFSNSGIGEAWNLLGNFHNDGIYFDQNEILAFQCWEKAGEFSQSG
ncbi:hypothetical protein HK096_003237 [Nowakowskiella sp. JEL0078]|nr:hypothetical protein HK096_003237 [Nowakowskiella sp. JEL0078]